MKKIGVYTNTDKDADMNITAQVCSVLDGAGLVSELVGPGDIKSGAMDALCVLGGDGTILGAAHYAAPAGIPILGINLGRLGFLSEIEISDISFLGGKLSSEDYTVENRMMLMAEYNGASETALNDIVFARGLSSRGLHISVSVSGQFLDSYMADGVIVSSPTGSTAYALSTGGPIISPWFGCMLISPICAHTLHARPVIVSDTDTIEIYSDADDEPAILSPDGREGIVIRPGEKMFVKKAPFSAGFIRLGKLDFYGRLHKKLSEW